jgi:hypothetical protein
MGKGAVFFILFIILAIALMTGCSKAKGSEEISQESPDGSLDVVADDSDSGSAVVDEPIEEEIFSLSTAKKGLPVAEASVKKITPDAVFVGAKATMDSAGKSEAWTYSFDSLKKSKGYDVMAGIVREKKFSFQQELVKWIDSPEAAEKCGAGEASLEAGKWVVASEKTICQLDAATGEKDEI